MLDSHDSESFDGDEHRRRFEDDEVVNQHRKRHNLTQKFNTDVRRRFKDAVVGQFDNWILDFLCQRGSISVDGERGWFNFKRFGKIVKVNRDHVHKWQHKEIRLSDETFYLYLTVEAMAESSVSLPGTGGAQSARLSGLQSALIHVSACLAGSNSNPAEGPIKQSHVESLRLTMLEYKVATLKVLNADAKQMARALDEACYWASKRTAKSAFAKRLEPSKLKKLFLDWFIEWVLMEDVGEDWIYAPEEILYVIGELPK